MSAPADYNSDMPLLFQHIPKCGGTSVRRVFKRWFGDGLFTHYYNAEKGGAPERRDLEALLALRGNGRGICLYGHFNRTRGFGVEQYYPDIEQLITIVRDPFEQHLSQYFYTKRKIVEGRADLPLVKEVGGDPGNVDSYIANTASSLLSYLPKEINEENYRSVIRERYLIVGIAERMAESVGLISDILGKPAIRVPVENVSLRAGVENLAGLREVFEEKNRLEMAIYRECLEIFREKADSRGIPRLLRSLRRRFR
jgi:hypothetical protein